MPHLHLKLSLIKFHCLISNVQPSHLSAHNENKKFARVRFFSKLTSFINFILCLKKNTYKDSNLHYVCGVLLAVTRRKRGTSSRADVHRYRLQYKGNTVSFVTPYPIRPAKESNPELPFRKGSRYPTDCLIVKGYAISNFYDIL